MNVVDNMLEKLKRYLICSKGIKDSDFSYFRLNKLAQFTIGSNNYMAEYDSVNDPAFFRIMLPIVETIDEAKRDQILERIVKVSSSYKVGKVITVGQNVWISAEVFIYNTDKSDYLFARLIDVLDSMLTQYRECCDGKQ